MRDEKRVNELRMKTIMTRCSAAFRRRVRSSSWDWQILWEEEMESQRTSSAKEKKMSGRNEPVGEDDLKLPQLR